MKSLLIIALCFLCGCATVVNGPDQTISISSEPPNANILIDGAFHNTTPATIEFKRDAMHLVRIEKEGYYPYETYLVNSVSGWIWGNVLLGGFVGAFVDCLSGGAYKLSPARIDTVLTKMGG